MSHGFSDKIQYYDNTIKNKGTETHYRWTDTIMYVDRSTKVLYTIGKNIHIHSLQPDTHKFKRTLNAECEYKPVAAHYKGIVGAAIDEKRNIYLFRAPTDKIDLKFVMLPKNEQLSEFSQKLKNEDKIIDLRVMEKSIVFWSKQKIYIVLPKIDKTTYAEDIKVEAPMELKELMSTELQAKVRFIKFNYREEKTNKIIENDKLKEYMQDPLIKLSDQMAKTEGDKDKLDEIEKVLKGDLDGTEAFNRMLLNTLTKDDLECFKQNLSQLM